jgi:hypothetical protein
MKNKTRVFGKLKISILGGSKYLNEEGERRWRREGLQFLGACD